MAQPGFPFVDEDERKFSGDSTETRLARSQLNDGFRIDRSTFRVTVKLLLAQVQMCALEND